jgi:hypothetical protein
MKNKAIDMHNILFEQLERLNDDEIKGEKLTEEIKRAEAINKTASQIINGARLALDFEKAKSEYNIDDGEGGEDNMLKIFKPNPKLEMPKERKRA